MGARSPTRRAHWPTRAPAEETYFGGGRTQVAGRALPLVDRAQALRDTGGGSAEDEEHEQALGSDAEAHAQQLQVALAPGATASVCVQLYPQRLLEEHTEHPDEARLAPPA